MDNNIVGILLAAGQSTRFGENKLLHPLTDGKTIVEHSVNNLLSACSNSIVVINNNTDPLKKILSETTIKFIENTNAEKGMGSSIARGVLATADADGWLIVLADMPFVQSKTIHLIMQNIKQSKCIIAPSFKQQRGHPVYFSKHFFKELVQLNEDFGARQIIKKYQDKITLIEIDDIGIFRDIDVLDDLNIKLNAP